MFRHSGDAVLPVLHHCSHQLHRVMVSREAGGTLWCILKLIFEPWICWGETQDVVHKDSSGPPLYLVKSMDTITHLWDEAHRIAAWGAIAVIISSCCIQATQALLGISAAGWCTHLQEDHPGLWQVVPPASLPQIPWVPQSWKWRSRTQLGQEGKILQQKRETTFQVQNLHLNLFINPKAQIRRRWWEEGKTWGI